MSKSEFPWVICSYLPSFHFVECLYLFTVLREIWIPCFSSRAAILLSLRPGSASRISWIRRIIAVREKLPFPLPLNSSRRGNTRPLNSTYFPATARLQVETWISKAPASAEREIARRASGPETKYSRCCVIRKCAISPNVRVLICNACRKLRASFI